MGNGSWTGILGLLRNDQCDFVVGGFFPGNISEHIKYIGACFPYIIIILLCFLFSSSPFLSIRLWCPRWLWCNCCLFPRLLHLVRTVKNTVITSIYVKYRIFQKIRYVFVAQKMPTWLGMLVIFEYITWIVTVTIFVVSVISWYFLGRISSESAPHTQFALCLLNSWAVTICIAVNNRPQRSPLRIFFLALALYSINLTTIYTSKLISVFTNPPYEDQIDTIEEIVESHLPIGKSIKAFAHSTSTSQINERIYLHNKCFKICRWSWRIWRLVW